MNEFRTTELRRMLREPNPVLATLEYFCANVFMTDVSPLLPTA